jgi:hypothetical protein
MAGSTDSPAAPTDGGSAMHTLEDLYNQVSTGTLNDKRSGSFVEPVSGPGSSTHTVDEIQALLPEPDNTDGAAQSEVLSGKTFWGLRTDGSWGSQTGTGAPAVVSETGQTTCYDVTGEVVSCSGTGQDGDLLSGAASPTPRFTDNDNSSVTDHRTGLIWLKNANCAGTRDWETALTDITQLNTDGTMNGNDCGDVSNGGSHQTDWRMPQRFELESLLNLEYSGPALSDTAGTGQYTAGDPFANVQSDYYWTSTTKAGSSASAWMVYFSNGYVLFGTKPDTHYVWPVRGGQ